MMISGFSALTPYLYKPFDPRAYRVNIGDGFILRAIERKIGKVALDLLFPAHVNPPADQYARLKKSRFTVLAGANQLQDNFTPWAGLKADQIRKDNLRFVPFGVGISGKPGGGLDLTEDAKEILRAIHEKIEFSSWRCPRTVAALERHLPELKGRFLMTCCPVALDTPLMEGKAFREGDKTIAVTITDRDDFWDREMPMLHRLAERFPKSRRVLVLHNDYAPPFVTASRIEQLRLPRKLVGNVLGARTLARKLGYEVWMPKSADEALAFYRNTADMHFGSRLHAHLLMLSWNKKSFLVSVDERMAGFSEYLGFPLCDGAKIDSYLDFDFEIVRKQAQKADVVMRKFTTYLQTLA